MFFAFEYIKGSQVGLQKPHFDEINFYSECYNSIVEIALKCCNLALSLFCYWKPNLCVESEFCNSLAV